MVKSVFDYLALSIVGQLLFDWNVRVGEREAVAVEVRGCLWS